MFLIKTRFQLGNFFRYFFLLLLITFCRSFLKGLDLGLKLQSWPACYLGINDFHLQFFLLFPVSFDELFHWSLSLGVGHGSLYLLSV